MPIEDKVSVTVEEVEETVAEEHVETREKSAGCSYYLGYLSERSSKDKIPDECMMCKDIVECMLKKAK
ncbi:MAG: hypothetical protein ACPLKZ_06495 [Candidatus Bathyarchaeales archaeon]